MIRSPLIGLSILLCTATAAQADPARDALACAGFWQANYDYEREVFLPIDVSDDWSDMARAGEAAARRLGATRIEATVAVTSQDMRPRLNAFLLGNDTGWFNSISRLCNRVLDREPEFAPFR